MAEGKQALKKQLSQTSTTTTTTTIRPKKATQRTHESATNRNSSSLSQSDVDLSISANSIKSKTKTAESPATCHSNSSSNRSSLCLRPHSADSSISSTFCFSYLVNQKCKLIKLICSFRFFLEFLFIIFWQSQIK